jgi:tetratricopeptide (TPR) repeat protein
MSNFFDDGQTRSEVEHLHRLAMDALAEDQYATMEQLLEQAVAIAEQLDDLSLLARERVWLADARRMLGKDRQAIATFTWLIGLAADPASSHQLTDKKSLSRYIAQAFIGFVESGTSLPEMPVEQLLRVVDDGLRWAERIGKPGWIAGLRLQLANLFRKRGDLKGARQEAEAALAVARRYPHDSISTLASYQLDLARLLINKAIGGYTEAIELAEEVLTATQNSIYDRQGAYIELAYARLALGENDAALRAAYECLSLAPTVGSPQAAYGAYRLIGQIHLDGNRPDEALAAAAQEWYWARRDGSVGYLNLALKSCARVRYLQALQACALPANPEILPEQVPVEADVLLAVRRLHSARRFIGWAQPLAARLDNATSSQVEQKNLHEILLSASKLALFLEKHPNAPSGLNQALALGEQDGWIIASRGETYRQLGRYEEALADFNQALALEENEDWYLYGRAQVHLLTSEMGAFQRDLSSALKLAQDKLSSTPTSDRWRIGFNIAVYHLLDGNAADAQSEYEELISTCTLLPSLRAAANDLKDLLKVQPQSELAQRIHARLRTRIAELKQ